MKARYLTIVSVAALTSTHALAAPLDAAAPAQPAEQAPAPAASAPAPAAPEASVPAPAALPASPAPAAVPAAAAAPATAAVPPASPAPAVAPAAVAPAPVPFDDTGVADDGSLGKHQSHAWFSLGLRTTRVSNAGFDVFADDDALAQFQLAFGDIFYADGPWSAGAALGWDVGSRSASVRGAATSLQAHRFTLNPELRYHFLRRLYAFGRLGAGAALLASSYSDAVTGTERTRAPLLFTLDATVGAAYEVLGQQSGASRAARGWLVLDAGYLFTANTDLVYSSESSSPARAAPVALGELSLSGLSGRVSAALTF
ncbi:MAG: hypothetical protein QM756_28390 [Polyangiaceae bacterium]